MSLRGPMLGGALQSQLLQGWGPSPQSGLLLTWKANCRYGTQHRVRWPLAPLRWDSIMLFLCIKCLQLVTVAINKINGLMNRAKPLKTLLTTNLPV